MASRAKPTAFELAFHHDGEKGVFTRDHDAEVTLSDPLQEAYFNGELSAGEAIKRAKTALHRAPGCLDLWHLLANVHLEAHAFPKALAVREEGFLKALSLVPADYQGQISYNSPDNMPFLRLAQGRVVDLTMASRTEEALELAQWLLARAPEDKLEVGEMVPDLLLKLGRVEEAIPLLLRHEGRAHPFPSPSYHLGRLRFEQGDFVAALTHLRRGFWINPYVAEMLTGRTQAFRHCSWLESNANDVEFAQAYLEDNDLKWGPAAVEFLDWAFNTAAVMVERAEMMAFNEGQLRTSEGLQKLSASLCKPMFPSSALSERLVRKVQNRWGVECWPWERKAMMGDLDGEQDGQ